ncbi:hypothetical protein Asd1617_06175 (plasmid) [Shigella dysenteriae 1617]|uniref:Uncharacterized protein n=1 Tax=Shigella dysenteriae 1617 TaxID=754093 RepID=A0A0A7A448_SHIDY|nr:hypothetical protein Asd1617_06175 [Shigella dysenteriae 1617]
MEDSQFLCLLRQLPLQAGIFSASSLSRSDEVICI